MSWICPNIFDPFAFRLDWANRFHKLTEETQPFDRNRAALRKGQSIIFYLWYNTRVPRADGASRFPWLRQRTFRREALPGQAAKKLANRHPGIVREQFKIVARGKPLPQFPFVDGGNGKAQVPGDLFQRDVPFRAPFSERACKAGADIATACCLLGHGERLPGIRLVVKRIIRQYNRACDGRNRRDIAARCPRRVQRRNGSPTGRLGEASLPE